MAKISLNGYELSYSFNGVSKSTNGVSVLLIHGAGGQEVDWPLAWRSLNDLTRSLGLTPKDHGGGLDNYPVYAIDLPGHGKSGGKSQSSVEEYANAVNEFVTAIELDNVCIVGHSMGASIALNAALNKYSWLTAIAMIGGASKMFVTDAILEGLKENFEPTIENIVKYSWYKNTGAFFKQKARQRMLEAGSKVVHDDFYACSQFDVSDRLAEIDVPTLVIASDHDRMVPLKISHEMANQLSRSTFVALENCGHFQHIEQTSRVAKELVNYLSTLG
ncbi:MAG: alpha/beta hydrolase [Planktomarina sp.]|jgi:pimeloyl-ACP methyl ester carboxylesterase|nr:alpha/beta hydrolase [Planktomarina sp.]MDT2084438.1 alpha/beta hydrolase [Planktomarina sp.]